MNSCGLAGSCRNVLALDVAIEVRGVIFDLSNLVSKLPGVASLSHTQGSRRQVRTPREAKRLYPMEKIALIIITEENSSNNSNNHYSKDSMIGKGKHRLSHPALFEQRNSFTRRMKTGPSTTFSTRDYQVEALGPGAYEFIPEDEYENLKPAPKLGISNNNKRIPYESNYTDTGSYQGHGASAFDKYSAMRGPESEPMLPAPRTKTDLQIEISPGVFARLRGSEETWNAIKSGNSTHAKCFSCELSLMCISDAEYVICPACRVVSPLLKESSGPEHKSSYKVVHPHSTITGGVGLGMQAY